MVALEAKKKVPREAADDLVYSKEMDEDGGINTSEDDSSAAEMTPQVHRFVTSGILLASDPPHDGKNERNATKGHWVRVNGWLVGMRICEVCIADTDQERRLNVQGALPLRVLRARCKFSVQDSRDQSAAKVQKTLLSDADRAKKNRSSSSQLRQSAFVSTV